MRNFKLLILALVIILFIIIIYKKSNLHTDKIIMDDALADSVINFQMLKLSTIGETNSGRICAADINGDEFIDIVAGFQWFEGPEWVHHQYALKAIGTKIDAGNTYTFDLDYDGDIDIVMSRRRADGGRELIWFENPGGSTKNIWKRHPIFNTVSCVEVIEFVDIDHDNRIEMVTVDDCKEPGLLIYEIPSDLTQEWPTRTVYKSKLHGLGIGDLDADGRLDIVSDYQWFANKPDGSWVRHTLPSPVDRSSIVENFMYRIRLAYRNITTGTAVMDNKRDLMNLKTLIYDIDDDGDNDILVTQAHTYGIYWLESSGGDVPSFTLHEILSRPSQLHGVAFADIDNDGDMDIFTGKSRYHHGDPGENCPLDVFWLELQREGNQVIWIKHPLSSALVMGFGPLIHDIDNDGDMDLVMRGLSFGNPPQLDVIIFLNPIQNPLKRNNK